ncbi:hypothetical protein D3C75_1373500 [compost metagenome]
MQPLPSATMEASSASTPTVLFKSTGIGHNSNLPASALEKSRMSFTRFIKRSALR